MTGKTSNAKGTLLLGYPEDGSDDEHLSIEHLLASNVDLSKGLMTIKCPKVEPRNNYVVLLSDTENRSPQFTIKH
ncbi:hypothetical protein BJ912DRAFT_1066860 [Pholiota molesta]|nr:hypothetical protein BJ912DRAFT_1066860 [Pholiota molesta]